ncbi:hypothetical protein EB796_014963 [Bugula neritina]|uniref:Uncharacterized protein n=1 Tax=Bugula neritina TaxID=10212 RepID=A0A7J7JMU8_BUGNE|nr:hypothetical protein EB796_014963 [Bugula neritina]
MLENYGQTLSGDSENRKEMTSSLPLHRDDPYQSAYKYHRRSYTTDGLVGGGGLNRTSTPYDNSVPTKTRAMDRSFTSISDIPLSSPREEPRARRLVFGSISGGLSSFCLVECLLFYFI